MRARRRAGASAAIGQDVYVGTITRVDQPARVVIFDDGPFRNLPADYS